MKKRTGHWYKHYPAIGDEGEASPAHAENMMSVVPKGSVALSGVFLKIQMLKNQIFFSEKSHCYSLSIQY